MPRGATARMSASSTCRRYQCRSSLWRLRSTIGYPTSCPGPWKVTSPPRSTSNSSTPRVASSAGDASRWRSFDERPSVTTGGCSTRSSRSSAISPLIRARATARWSASASAYGIVRRSETRSWDMRRRLEPSNRCSSVNHLAKRVERRFGHRLGERRVCVDGQVHLLHRVLVRASDDELVDQLGGVRADDVSAEDLSVLGATNDLHEALRLTGRAGAAAGREGEFSDLVLDLALLALLLGESDRRHLGVAVGRPGDVRVVEQMGMLAGDHFGHDHALALSLVREHRRTGHVTDRVQSLHARLHPLADLDEAAIGELNALLLEPDLLDVRRATGRDEHDVDLELLLLAAGFDGHGDGILADLDVRDLGAGEDVDLPLLERALDLLGRIRVLDGQDVRHHLEQRDLRSEGGEDVGELAADGARADDGVRLRRLLQHERLVRRDHGLLVQLQPDLRQPLHARAGGDDDRLLRVVLLLLSVRRLHTDGVLARELRRALDPGDLVLLEQELDPLRVLRADGARPLHRHAVVELHLAGRHTEVGRLLHLLGDVCRLEQRLRRDAPPDDAGAAEPFALDDGGVEAELGGADRADVAGGAAADADHAERSHGQSTSMRGFSIRRRSV